MEDTDSTIRVSFEQTSGVETSHVAPLVEDIETATGEDEGATVRYRQSEWEGYDGQLSTVLELLYSSPAFDNVDSDEVVAALGHGIHAVISMPNQQDIVATNPDFDATEPISRANCPVSVGDIIPVNDSPATYVDWPTGGPQFDLQLEDGSTMVIQLEPAEDVFQL